MIKKRRARKSPPLFYVSILVVAINSSSMAFLLHEINPRDAIRAMNEPDKFLSPLAAGHIQSVETPKMK